MQKKSSAQSAFTHPRLFAFILCFVGAGLAVTGFAASKDAPPAPAMEARGVPPSHDLESAIIRSVAPENYTAILSAKTDSGIALIEIYNIK